MMTKLPNGSNLICNGTRNDSGFFELFEEPSLFNSVITYIYFFVLNLVGRMRDFLRNHGLEKNRLAEESIKNKGFVPLYNGFEAFFTRNVYRRVRDTVNKPICSVPGADFDLMNRVSDDHNWTFRFLGTTSKILNFGSYNYLGFAMNDSICIENVKKSIIKHGLAVGSPRQETGNTTYHKEVEKALAHFIGQESAIIFPMGFATNSLNIPILADKNCCVISDELNHVSLILGIRLSGAEIRRFKHNNMESLESVLRSAIIDGHSRSHRVFKRILVVVEGVYSMEGSIVRLPEIIELKKKYKFYLYLDEAHSIGALGKQGKGVVDYFHLNPKDIDIQMGTFTKSFGSAGGYICGSKKLIEYLRERSHSTIYGGTISSPVCEQILSTMAIIEGRIGGQSGQQRIRQLAWNTNYFRAALHRMGLIVFGNKDSPVVPVILYTIPKIVKFHRECIERGIGTVIVGFPACSLNLARVRFCISASHTKDALDYTLSVVEEMADLLRFRFSKEPIPKWCDEFPDRPLSIDGIKN